MANTFKNYTSASVGTSPVTTYTVPASTTTVVLGLSIANTETSSINISVQVAGIYLTKNTPIPSGSALSVLDGKLVLEATDTVVVTSDTAASADALLSIMEQT